MPASLREAYSELVDRYPRIYLIMPDAKKKKIEEIWQFASTHHASFLFHAFKFHHSDSHKLAAADGTVGGGAYTDTLTVAFLAFFEFLLDLNATFQLWLSGDC